MALDMRSLVQALRPPSTPPDARPVFFLLGHGVRQSGAMHLWSDEWMDPTSLLKLWQPNFGCDLIATQCGANAFVSPMRYPILMHYNLRIRFMAAAEPLAECSHRQKFDDDQELHVELTSLLITYLRVHDNGCDQSALRKSLAWLQSYKQRSGVTAPPSTTTPSELPAPPVSGQTPPIVIDKEATTTKPTPKAVIWAVILGLLWLEAVPHKLHFIVVWLLTTALYRLYQWLALNK